MSGRFKRFKRLYKFLARLFGNSSNFWAIIITKVVFLSVCTTFLNESQAMKMLPNCFNFLITIKMIFLESIDFSLIKINTQFSFYSIKLNQRCEIYPDQILSIL